MATRILIHSDEVSGTTVFDDGTKMYWTEGRSSTVVVVRPDGTQEEFDPYYATDAQHALYQEEQRIEENADEYRQMTAKEEAEWEAVMYPDTQNPVD